jgi:poly(ADP-ribose) glycohydrolase ARH3
MKESTTMVAIEPLNTPLTTDPELADRFRGCFLGLAIGDALGGRFEAQSAEHICSRCPTVTALIDYPQDEIWYTDDTQMAIGVAESLAKYGQIIEEHLCKAFVDNYVPSRGYGRGARAVLDAMENGQDYRQVATKYFPGGSYGNGAAMRVAPVGLFFRDAPEQLLEQARLSALPTHLHPLGIEGAQLLALAVSLSSKAERLDRADFFEKLLSASRTVEFRGKLATASRAQNPNDLAQLGNGIEALESVVTAIASFAMSPESYSDTIAQVIFLGGDTDTMAAMAGALSGAYFGAKRLPKRLIGLLEDSPKGRRYIIDLADQLVRAHAPAIRK